MKGSFLNIFLNVAQVSKKWRTINNNNILTKESH